MPTGHKAQPDKETVTRLTRNLFILNIAGCHVASLGNLRRVLSTADPKHRPVREINASTLLAGCEEG